MNSVARSGVFAPRMLGRSHVPRFKLVSGISLHLERDGFLAMCCEPGMGCKTLVCDVAASLEARGFSTACAVIDVEFVEASLRSARRTAKALIAGCARPKGSYALDSSDETFLAIECPGLLDDRYLVRVCSIVTLALASGCWVLLLLHPDAEYILEILPACHVMRSDELCVGMDEFPLWVGLLGSFDERTAACATHGIPLLMASLGSAGVGADGHPYGPSWDRSVCGIVEEALRPSLIYEELCMRGAMLARELRGQRPGVPSVFSALLQLDFEALRCLVGDPSSAAEQTGLACAEAVLERGGLPALGDGARLRREMAYAMAGEGWGFTDLGRVMGRQGDVGETAELAVLHLVASLSDAADGSFQQANVHAWEAFRRAAENGMDDIACLATMAERIALDGLGEGHRAAALVHEGVEGIASDVQALVSLHASLGRSGKRETGELTEQMRRVSPRVGLAALAAFVVRADRIRGAMLARALPGAWRVRLDSDAPQEGMGTRPRALPAPRESRASQTVIPPLEVCVLGGLTLTRGERRITEKGWRRKTARSLMALLALTPGHVVTRFEAIEFLWPEADYDRGRENLYSTLSSLRQTIGQVSGEASYLITEMGQIWLDETLVTCDVDGFEELARSVVGGSLRDDEVVAACLRMDGAFRGGACAPPVDPHGRLRARCDELMRRYVDVLLVGAEAALRLRDVRQAIWFAESASAAASTREDVVACLARALGAVDDAKRGPAPEPSDDL